MEKGEQLPEKSDELPENRTKFHKIEIKFLDHRTKFHKIEIKFLDRKLHSDVEI